MNAVTICIVVVGVLIVASIIGYMCYKKFIKHQSVGCDCGSHKTGKDLVKAYHKEYGDKKEEGECCCCHHESSKEEK